MNEYTYVQKFILQQIPKVFQTFISTFFEELHNGLIEEFQQKSFLQEYCARQLETVKEIDEIVTRTHISHYFDDTGQVDQFEDIVDVYSQVASKCVTFQLYVGDLLEFHFPEKYPRYFFEGAKEIKLLKTDVELLEKLNDDLVRANDESEQKLTGIEVEYAEVQQHLNNTKVQLQNYQEQISDDQEMLVKLSKEIERLKKLNKELELAKKLVEQQLMLSEKQRLEIENILEKVKKDNSRIKSDFEIVGMQMHELKCQLEQQIAEMNEGVAETKESLIKEQQEKQALQNQLYKIQSEVAFKIKQHNEKSELLEEFKLSKAKLQQENTTLIETNERYSQHFKETAQEIKHWKKMYESVESSSNDQFAYLIREKQALEHRITEILVEQEDFEKYEASMKSIINQLQHENNRLQQEQNVQMQKGTAQELQLLSEEGQETERIKRIQERANMSIGRLKQELEQRVEENKQLKRQLVQKPDNFAEERQQLIKKIDELQQQCEEKEKRTQFFQKSASDLGKQLIALRKISSGK